MSHKHQNEEEGCGGAGLGTGEEEGEQHKAQSPRTRQQNGPAAAGDAPPPVRRSWRPCQMLSPDGEPTSHHHHHHHHHHPPPSGRGQQPRPRRRQGPGPGQLQGQGGLAPVPSRHPDQGGVVEPEARRPVQQHPRPGVARYRRQGDPNPRVHRAHRQRPALREAEDAAAPSSSASPRLRTPDKEDESGSQAEEQQQRLSSQRHASVAEQPNLTPVAMLTPTEDAPAHAPAADPQTRSDCPPSCHAQGAQEESREEEEKEPEEQDEEEVEEEEGKRLQEDDRDSSHAMTYSDRSHGNEETAPTRDEEEEVAAAEETAPEWREAESNREIYLTEEGGADDALLPGGGEEEEECATDLCSDTESAASLNMDGPLHSPPPLCSPTPPSSPELGRPCGGSGQEPYQEEEDEPGEGSSPPSPAPLDNGEEDGSSESGSPPKSYTDSYPKTYADFYTESHQKSPAPEALGEPSAKPHPDSFPEPLTMSYPEVRREPARRTTRPSRRTGEGETRGEAAPARQEGTDGRRDVAKRAPVSPVQCRGPPRDRGRPARPIPPAWQGRSAVGCRLHHYDCQSDGESDDADGTTGPRRTPAQREDAQAKSPPLACRQQNGSAEEEESGTGSGGRQTISLAIRDIREAIEEVKTKAVRSPYTPDRPGQPVWVMRQEDASAQQQHSPVSQSPSESLSESPSRYAPAPSNDSVSPVRAEASRIHQQQQQQYHQQPTQQHHPQGHPPPQQIPPTRPYTQPPPHAANSLPVVEKHQQLRQQHDPRQQQHQHRQQQQQQQQHHEQLQQQPPQQQPPPPHQHQQPQPQSAPVPQQPSVQEIRRSLPSFPTYVDVPGPCDPDDLIDGIIFAASYLGSTQLLSERTPTKAARMQQAQEAMSRVRVAQKQAKNRKKSPDGEVPSSAEVDLFMSTQRIKVLNADTQESMMDLALRTISYIADIGNMVVLMARGKMVRSRSAQESLDNGASEQQQTMALDDSRRQYRMVCHVFESEDAQLIAQSIGQAFSVAYQEFLRANGIDPEDLSQREYSDLLNTQDMYNDDLIHFSKSENCKDVYIEKQKGEMLGVVIVESGWGSILPTVIIASMMHAGPAEKSGRLNIGDQLMTVNGTSLVGLPLSTCQSIIKGLKSQARVKLNIVRCPPVTMVLIRRPDLRYQLGFSVQNGIICSLMRGGIAERGGVRVGHRIIEINSQSVVATPHEKIVHILSNAVGEIHMKTMPAAMYRLLTAQEHPVYI